MDLLEWAAGNVGCTVVYAGEDYFITWSGNKGFHLVGLNGKDFNFFSVCGEVESVERAIIIATKHAAELEALSCIVCGNKSDEVPFDDETGKCITCLHEEEEGEF